MFFRFQEVGRTDVGSQHALLNQPMRVVTDDRHDRLDLAVVVELHLCFNSVKINRATLFSGGMQRLEQCIERLQLRLNSLVHRGCRR